MEEEKN